MLFMKNRCIFKDLQLLDDFVANLLYPAILGSLIYEFTNFKLSELIKYIFLLITAIFYIIDYFYMHYAFEYFKNENKRNIRSYKMICLDIIDTLSFALIILFINKSWFNLIISPTIFIFIVEDNYLNVLGNEVELTKFWIPAFITMLIIYLFLFFHSLNSYFNWNNCLNRPSFFNWLFLIGYVLFVIQYMMLAISTYKDYPIKTSKWK